MADRCRRLAADIKPLAIAANATQADDARLDVVILTLGHLFFIYSDWNRFSHATRDRIITSLEKRWSNCGDDREIYILAVVLNPYIRTTAFRRDNPATTFNSLYSMLTRCFKRMFQRDADPEMTTVFSNYLRRLDEFSDEEMRLADEKLLAERKVPHPIIPRTYH